jgi:hypothetical protein
MTQAATIDFAPILRAVLRSQAVYEEDAGRSKAAFESLGYEWLGQFRNAQHQAVVSCDALGTYLSISGTRFSDGELGDLYDDLDLDAVRADCGGLVTCGAFHGLDELWSWARSLVALNTSWTIDGHSLGAWRARYSPLLISPVYIERIYSFASPKGGDAALWAAMMPALADKLVSVVNDLDIFVSYPFELPLEPVHWVHPPLPMLRLLSEAPGCVAITTDAWPGGRRLSDHCVASYAQRLATLVAQQKASAALA